MTTATVRIWDPLVRVVHWTVAVVFLANYALNEAGDDWHRWLGYTAAAALVVRLVWGFTGARGAARWSHSTPTPARLAAHARALRQGRQEHRLGHSPIGALVMWLMMILMLLLGATGFMMNEVDRFWGVQWLEDLHIAFADILLGLVLLHIAAAIYESLYFKENLPWSMVTGKRRLPLTPSDQQD